ncbi:MAG: hypothetical protein ABIT10_10600 [Alteraurantiacibacter sp.]
MSDPNPNSASDEFPEPKVIYDFDPFHLPPEYLQAVGLVVAASSQTESVMRELIGALLNIDNVEAIALCAHMTAPLKDHVARTLIELNAPGASEVDELDDLLDAVEGALTKRNTVVHNSFLIDPGTQQVMSWREKARGSLQTALVPVTVEEIQQDAALINKAGLDVIEFMMRHGLGPRFRKGPLREVLDRKKKARAERRARFGAKY